MAFEQALRAFLAADTGINTLVSSRIYPEVAPESDPFPRLTYAVVSYPEIGYLGGRGGLASPRVQIRCAGSGPTGYGDAKALAAAVLAATGGNQAKPQTGFEPLDGFRGTMGGVGGVPTVNIECAECVDRRDGYDPPIHGDDVTARWIDLDFQFWIEGTG